MKLAAALLLVSTAAAADVTVPDRITVAVGATAPLALAIVEPRAQLEGVIVDVAPEAGVAVKKRRLGAATSFEIPVRGEAAGEHAVAIRVRYWACRAHACRPIDVRVKTIVVVTDS